jgi:hypothetical protein
MIFFLFLFISLLINVNHKEGKILFDLSWILFELLKLDEYFVRLNLCFELFLDFKIWKYLKKIVYRIKNGIHHCLQEENPLKNHSLTPILKK